MGVLALQRSLDPTSSWWGEPPALPMISANSRHPAPVPFSGLCFVPLSWQNWIKVKGGFFCLFVFSFGLFSVFPVNKKSHVKPFEN